MGVGEGSDCQGRCDPREVNVNRDSGSVGCGVKARGWAEIRGVAWQKDYELTGYRPEWIVELLTLLLERWLGGFALKLGLFEPQCSYLQNGKAAPNSRAAGRMG